MSKMTKRELRAYQKRQHSINLHIATMVGANERASKCNVLGEKLYWRLMRDTEQLHLLKMGVRLEFTDDVTILTIPCGEVYIKLRPDDIEMMRATVAEYDAQSTEFAKALETL